MIGKIRYGNTVIQYSVVKSNRRKTSEIQIDHKGVIFRVPAKKTSSEIKKTIEVKKQWIYKKQLEFAKRPQEKMPPRKYSRSFVLKRVRYYSDLLQVRPQKIVFKKLKARWGSTTKDSVVNLSNDLLKTPKVVIDYVVLHELCHMRINDHSYKFWDLLRKFMPDYRSQKTWLELNSNKIIDPI